jgi:AraC-like DNA-binding protein
MIEDAERKGLLTEGALIIEPTSGNTGVGLAIAAAVKGYKLILTMPDSMSLERRLLLGAYGAQIVLTPGADGMAGSIAKALELQAQNPGSWIPQQFENFSNPALNVESIAVLMQMNRSVLSRMFANTFKTTIIRYLAGRRLNEALRLLKETELPINRIAELCGYSCHNYFTKVIRRHTGNSPNSFRKM